MPKVQATDLFTEFLSRNASSESILDPNFHVQNASINDPCRRVGINCTRRSGKTIGFGNKVLKTAKEFPGCEMIYIALTGGSARDILWQELLDRAARCGIKTRTNKIESKIYFIEYRSSIKFAGVDCSEKEMRKVLGKKYKLAGVDESGSFTINMEEFIYQKLEPTLIDLEGQLYMLGTCEMIPNTFFQSVTENKQPGWSVHRWTAHENPYVARQWREMIKRMISENPKVQDAAWFKTHYLNQWVTDDSLILVTVQEFNVIDYYTPKPGDVSVMGVDLGLRDSNAFSVVSYNHKNPKFTIRESWKQSGMDFTDTANAIRDMMGRYDIIGTVIDGANAQGVEEMRRRHNLNLEPAEKSDKLNYLRMLSDDLKCGRGEIVRSTNKDLLIEWSHLIRDPKNPAREDPRCENHLSDASLYAWRKCFHYGYIPEENAPKETESGYEDYLEGIELQSQLEEKEFWDI